MKTVLIIPFLLLGLIAVATARMPSISPLPLLSAKALLPQVGMSFPDKVKAGIADEVYISLRKDGVIGSGIATDPYDGSTAAKFDGIFAAYSQRPNVTFHLGPGTFQTAFAKNAIGITLYNGWKISGAGRDLTTIQLVTHAFDQPGHRTMLSSAGDFDNQVVEDLTVDGNIQNQPAATEQLCISGIGLNGRVSRVKVLNCGTTKDSPDECFWIFDGSGLSGPSYNQIVEDCICIAPATPMYISFITVSGNPSSVDTFSRGAIIRGCKVYCPSTTGTFDGHAFMCANVADAVVEDNYSDGITAGYYQDTWTNMKLIVRGNSFLRAGTAVQISNQGLYQAVGNPPLTKQAAFYNQTLIIEDNYIDLLPQPNRQTGIAIHDVLNEQVLIRGNTIRATPNPPAAPANDMAGIVVDETPDFHDNNRAQIQDNCVDIPSAEEMVTCNPYGNDSKSDLRSFVEAGDDYENNYSSDGDFLVGRHHSRFTFYPTSEGWYTVFNKLTTDHSSGRMSLFTSPLPSEAHGTGTLVAGSAVIDSTAVLPTSQIIIKQEKPGGVPGLMTVATGDDAIISGKSFHVVSTSKDDTSSFSWTILNGGTDAGEFTFDQQAGGNAGRLNQLAAAPKGGLATVDQVRSYSSAAGGNEVDIHVTAPSKVTIEYNSDNAYYGYYDDVAPGSALGAAISSTPANATVTGLTFDPNVQQNP
jgi:hypothetical protein